MLEALQAKGLRGLDVEIGETDLDRGQLRTRLETFFEMLGD